MFACVYVCVWVYVCERVWIYTAFLWGLIITLIIISFYFLSTLSFYFLDRRHSATFGEYVCMGQSYCQCKGKMSKCM